MLLCRTQSHESRNDACTFTYHLPQHLPCHAGHTVDAQLIFMEILSSGHKVIPNFTPHHLPIFPCSLFSSYLIVSVIFLKHVMCVHFYPPTFITSCQSEMHCKHIEARLLANALFSDTHFPVSPLSLLLLSQHFYHS